MKSSTNYHLIPIHFNYKCWQLIDIKYNKIKQGFLTDKAIGLTVLRISMARRVRKRETEEWEKCVNVFTDFV